MTCCGINLFSLSYPSGDSNSQMAEMDSEMKQFAAAAAAASASWHLHYSWQALESTHLHRRHAYNTHAHTHTSVTTHNGAGHRLKVKPIEPSLRSRPPFCLHSAGEKTVRWHSRRSVVTHTHTQEEREQCVRFYPAELGRVCELIRPRDAANYADTSYWISLSPANREGRQQQSRERHTAQRGEKKKKNTQRNK